MMQCVGGYYNETPTFATRTQFATTSDGDNDVNPGDSVNLALIMNNGEIDTHVNRVVLRLGTEIKTVTGGSIPSHGGGLTLANDDFVVPAGAGGTVLEARVESRYYEYNSVSADCTTATGQGIVGLYVNKAPALADDTTVTDPATPVTADVLGNDDATNDSVPGGVTSNNPTVGELATQDEVAAADPEQVAITADAANGSCVIETDGQVTYTPDDEFAGDDECTYSVTDNDEATSTAKLSIDVAEAVVTTLEVTASQSEVNQGGSVTLTATGLDQNDNPMGDVTDQVTFVSDVAGDEIDGNTVTFPHASPHTITGTHVAGASDSVVVDVIPAAVPGPDPDPTPVPDPDPDPADQIKDASPLPDTGAQPLSLAWAGLLMLVAGGAFLSRGRTTSTD